MSDDVGRPLPIVDVESTQYWAALREHAFSAQHCNACATTYLYPRILCPECHSDDVTWLPLGGRGEIYSYTVSRRAAAPGFVATIPLVVALVTLEEGPRIMTNIVGAHPDEVRVGAPVELEYLDLTDDITLPVFRQISLESFKET